MTAPGTTRPAPLAMFIWWMESRHRGLSGRVLGPTLVAELNGLAHHRGLDFRYTERDLRDMVSQLRREAKGETDPARIHIICSATGANPGYFVAESREEAERSMRSQMRRAIQMFRAAHGFKVGLARKFGARQLRFRWAKVVKEREVG